MIKKLYAMKDNLNGYMSPFVDISDDIARRNFDVMCKKNDLVYFNPDDFSLFRIGEYDTDTGKLLPIEPEFVCSAYIKKEGE